MKYSSCHLYSLNFFVYLICRSHKYSVCHQICDNIKRPKQQKHKISFSTKLVIAYIAYLNMPICNHDKLWSPHVCCKSCWSKLEGWLGGKTKCMSFIIFKFWWEPTNHQTDYKFCVVDVFYYRKSKTKKALFT